MILILHKGNKTLGKLISGGCPGSKSHSWFPDHICLTASSAALGFLCPNREDWGKKNPTTVKSQ